jgi:hypothetical protein
MIAEPNNAFEPPVTPQLRRALGVGALIQEPSSGGERYGRRLVRACQVWLRCERAS